MLHRIVHSRAKLKFCGGAVGRYRRMYELKYLRQTNVTSSAYVNVRILCKGEVLMSASVVKNRDLGKRVDAV